MAQDVPLRCRCGVVRGTIANVSPRASYRLVCMCDDCQAYARHLAQPDTILDGHGGTDIFYPTPAQVSISEGLEHMRCLRLSAQGLLRWYASCCNTPMAHTVESPKVPFVGIPHTFIAIAVASRRDALLGPVFARVRGRFGTGTLPRGAFRGVPLRALLRGYVLLLWGWIRRKHQPSPFFDTQTGQPVVMPTVLSSSERDALRTAERP